jgi:hypothetical protein
MSHIRKKIQQVNWNDAKHDLRRFIIDKTKENDINLNHMEMLTPPPNFASMSVDYINSLPKGHPVLDDLHNFSLEGNIDAITLRNDANIRLKHENMEP